MIFGIGTDIADCARVGSGSAGSLIIHLRSFAILHKDNHFIQE